MNEKNEEGKNAQETRKKSEAETEGFEIMNRGINISE